LTSELIIFHLVLIILTSFIEVSLQYFDSNGWVTGRPLACNRHAAVIPNASF